MLVFPYLSCPSSIAPFPHPSGGVELCALFVRSLTWAQSTLSLLAMVLAVARVQRQKTLLLASLYVSLGRGAGGGVGLFMYRDVRVVSLVE